MKRIWLMTLLSFLFAGCDTVRTMEDSGIIKDDILQDFVQTDDPALLAYYADEIAECEKLNAAYSVYATDFDLNQDGSAETISYLLSTLSSGSNGNIFLHLHLENRVLPFSDEVFLNPHPDGKQFRPKLQVIKSESGAYPDIRYAVYDDSGASVKEQIFRFDSSGYIS